MAEQIRKQANWAASLGVAGFLCMPVVAPFAVYLGHRSLGAIRRSEAGLEHRGAARVGVILGWLGSALLAFALVASALEIVELLDLGPQSLE